MTNISNSDWIKISINIFVGFLTILIKAFVPIGGGGISLIFVLTIPFTLGLSILSSLLYFYLATKGRIQAKNVLFVLVVLVNLFVTFSMYPYAENG